MILRAKKNEEDVIHKERKGGRSKKYDKNDLIVKETDDVEE